MKKIFLCILVLLLVFPAAASALRFTYEFDTEFSGATAPEGATPWLEATFDDEDSPGTVILYLEASNLTDSEFVSEWLFNFDPRLNITNLLVTDYDISEVGTVSYAQGTDIERADGDGFFDIVFSFNNGEFIGGDEAWFEFSREGLLASSFDFYSAPGPGQSPGPFLSAAHIQSIGDGDSGWIAPVGETEPVPEPATMLLLGSGLIGIAGFGRKKFKK